MTQSWNLFTIFGESLTFWGRAHFSLWSILAIPMTLWGEGFTTWSSHHPLDTQTESEVLLGSVEAMAGGGHDSGVLCLCCGCWKLRCCVPWQQSWCFGPVLWHLGFRPGCMVREPSSLEIIQANPTSFLLSCKFSYDLKLTENLQEFASNPYIYIPIYSWFWFIFLKILKKIVFEVTSVSHRRCKNRKVEFPYILHPSSLSDNNLQNHSMIIKTKTLIPTIC